MTFIYIYMIVINFITFIYMGIDKRKASHHSFRIPERVLLILSLFGGSLGTLLGMFIFHHKTKKKKFVIGVPFLLLINFMFLCFSIQFFSCFPLL